MMKFLKPTGKLVSVMSVGWQTQTQFKQVTLFKDFLGTFHHEVFDLKKGSFKASGTNVNACIIAIDGSAWV